LTFYFVPVKKFLPQTFITADKSINQYNLYSLNDYFIFISDGFFNRALKRS